MADIPELDHIEVTARVPRRAGRVSITVEIDAREPAATAGTAPSPTDDFPVAACVLAGGRPLPDLLFATHAGMLAARITDDGYRRAKEIVRAAGKKWFEVDSAADPLAAIRKAAQGKAGIVLVGGYDVLPGRRFDTLPQGLRDQLGNNAGNESDSFVVWSDQDYADVDNDKMADMPISRIPDAASADFLLGCLTGTVSTTARRFGLRNAARPFADDVFHLLSGEETLLLSAPVGPGTIRSATLDADALYVMLHGDWSDGTGFWGERPGGFLKALEIEDVPAACKGVVFSGCCWGALIVDQPACFGNEVKSRTVTQSMALTFLAAGARAFVGSTGSHYSPTDPPYDYFGGPMHAAFWQRIAAGEPPAKALYTAKAIFVSGMPHGRVDPSELAIEYKTLRQFTCLGLGW